MEVKTILQDGQWKLLYQCPVSQQDTSNNEHYRMDISGSDSISVRTQPDSPYIISSQQLNEDVGTAAKAIKLTDSQITSILENLMLDRMLARCNVCTTLQPFVVWQISAEEMRYCAICTGCRRVENLLHLQ